MQNLSDWLIAVIIFIAISMTCLNILQNWYWSRQVQTLVDKVMSKNYADYVQTNKKAMDLPKKIELPVEEQDEDVADALNKMLGPQL